MSFVCQASDVADMCNIVSSNPDISGVGVRTAIYAQTLLSLISSSLMPNDNIAFRDSSRTTYIVSCALIASSIAQWKHGGLSLFDGIVSTMLTTLMTVFVTTNYRYIQTLGVSIQIANFLFTSFWFYWGIQVWSDPSTFGLEPSGDGGSIAGCTANIDTVFVVFGRSISATNNGIRIFALCVFSIFGSVLSITALWYAVWNIRLYWKYGGANTKHFNIESTVMREEYGEEYDLGPSGGGITRVSLFGGVLGLGSLVYLIVTTELIVLRNPSVHDDLSKWTFGQTLGVIMIGQQLMDIFKCWTERNGFKMESKDAEHLD